MKSLTVCHFEHYDDILLQITKIENLEYLDIIGFYDERYLGYTYIALTRNI